MVKKTPRTPRKPSITNSGASGSLDSPRTPPIAPNAAESVLEASRRDPRLPELKDFRNFLFLAFKHLKHTPTRIQYDVADKLQYGSKRLIVSAYRGMGKSWISVMFTLWYLYWNPNAKVLVVSAAKQKADQFSQFCLKLIQEIDELRWMYPSDDQRRSMIQFDISIADASKDASVTSLGMYSQLTGSRADLIIADDVEVPKTSETHSAREKLAEAVKEFESILKPTDDARIIYLGTPQCEDSLYNKLISRGYKRVIWPARVPSDKWMLINGHELANIIKEEVSIDNQNGYGSSLDRGKPTDKGRFDEDELVEKEVSVGRSTFDLQFMLDTTLSDQNKFPLKLKDLLVMEFSDKVPELPVWSPDHSCLIDDLDSVGMRGDRFYKPISYNGIWKDFDLSIMAIDPAGTGKDELAYCVVKHLNGILYLCESDGLEGGYYEGNLELLANRAKEHKVKDIIVEANFGDGMFERLLQPYLTRIYPCHINSIKNYKNKEQRIIDTLEPVMNNHKLVVNKDVIKNDLAKICSKDTEIKRLFFQMTRLTKVKGSLQHDDRLDCLAMAINWFKERVNVDSQEAIKKNRQRELMKQVRDFHSKGKKNNTFISSITGRDRFR